MREGERGREKERQRGGDKTKSS
jgi:hypothetical protein